MEVVFRSDTGKKRKNNQDFAGYFINKQNVTLAILCDGMGGHRGGDVASEMAVSHLGHSWEESDVQNAEQITQWMLTRISRENKRILEKSRKFSDLEGMGTTLVATALVEQEFVIANIGDSRGYHYTGGRLSQVTEDHSLVNELLKSGEISSEDAENHPRKNVLTRSLGVTDEIDIDVTILPALPNDQMLLCSDGLTNMVEDEAIKEVLSTQKSLDEKVETLITMANEHGGYDNITIILVHTNAEGRGSIHGNR
ncbi:Stp1/IreP family PP2C-type Ser/Thr phosphatase [Carnobacterium viridans]|uniref:protein-serine/threonine phosphatase n=1 Tax=Carnobacterium viridans TaxID=174587 RepID=A0A1H0XSV8_9LACT|nr:Stp1/IreP family PP2C-type Ser/Thr phosphatase [Carnobacterium viridans]UDE95561.1 Stp1/IreP family PP2C-type Ser/Thr phosphatase [Carnobacterium viridans]SDQ05955.1 protein phosphatase [Carnobacterium viridans]